MDVVSVEDLHKSYGSIQALKGVTLQVQAGTIFGLLGQNGAGKSTFIKILLGIVKKTNGTATLLGQPAGVSEVRKQVGYLPEDHQFPQYHSAASLLDFYGQLYGLSRAERLKRADEALEIVGLRKRKDYKIRTYSKGMKQRLGIAQSFFHDPQVIFLDEPTDGVDPVGRKEIRDLLIQLKSEGRTIFVNSHLLGEVEMISDRVAIMHQGRLVREGTVGDLTKQEGSYTIGLAPGEAFPVEAVQQLGLNVQKTEGDLYEVLLGAHLESIDRVINLLNQKGLHVRHLLPKKQTLEDVFVKVVDGTGGEPGTDDRRAQPVNRRAAIRRETE